MYGLSSHSESDPIWIVLASLCLFYCMFCYYYGRQLLPFYLICYCL